MKYKGKGSSLRTGAQMVQRFQKSPLSLPRLHLVTHFTFKCKDYYYHYYYYYYYYCCYYYYYTALMFSLVSLSVVW